MTFILRFPTAPCMMARDADFDAMVTMGMWFFTRGVVPRFVVLNSMGSVLYDYYECCLCGNGVRDGAECMTCQIMGRQNER